MEKAKLYLIPNTLGEKELPEATMGTSVKSAIEALNHFAVENLKVTRRYFVRWGLKHKIDQSEFVLHSKKSDDEGLRELERIFKEGHSIGMISDAGCPGIADPGNQLVQLAHRLGVRVVSLSGPSSIFLALMGSGMNGQHFSFNGYLPIDATPRAQAINRLENQSSKEGSTQIFMETPYRNQALFLELIQHLSPKTKLCIACQLTTPKEMILTKSVLEWKELKQLPDLNKKPTIFLLQA